jgi:dipeptidyl aminopeptidase/acylaminoacyl peptidase
MMGPVLFGSIDKRRALLWPVVVALAFLLAACGGGEPQSPTPEPTPTRDPADRTNLAPLFAPPTEEEIAAVRADWASRHPVAAEWVVESTGEIDGAEVWVVSHVVDGNRHYGAVRFPRGYTPGSSLPVLVVNHGGLGGLDLDHTLSGLDQIFAGDSCLADNFLYVLPTFRSEPLNSQVVGYYVSEGDATYLDWDVDDAMALLDGVLTNIPEADAERVAVFGESRGGGVSLLMGVRDERVKAVAVFYAPADFTMPYYELVLQAMIDTGATDLDHLLMPLVLSYIDGTTSLADTRFILLKHSPAQFASDMPSLQFHHGNEDYVIPIEHSERLNGILEGLGAGAPEYEYFTYEGGGHSIYTLPGSADRVSAFICGELLP